METRTLQEVGGGTYTVSIPKRWADRHGLEAGATINVFTHDDGSVVLRADSRDAGSLESIRASVPDADPAHVERSLLAGYGVGYERVRLATGATIGDDCREAARRAAGERVATEVLVEDENTVAAQTLLDADTVSPRQALLQARYAVDALVTDVRRSVRAGHTADTPGVSARREEADRLSALVTRHFQRSLRSLAEVDALGLDRGALFAYHRTARRLARVARGGERVAGIADDLDGGVLTGCADDLADHCTAVGRVLDDAAAAVLEDGSVPACHDVLDDCTAVERAVDAMDLCPDADAGPAGGALATTLGEMARDATGVGRVALEIALARADD